MKQIPLWQQYGFSSKKELLDRYPEFSGGKPKHKPKKRSKTKSRKR